MSVAADLVAKLAAAGTPPELLAAVAEQLFAGQSAKEIVEGRKAKDRQRKRTTNSEEIQGTPRKSKESAEIRGRPPKVSPKDKIKTPSSPPVDASEAEASSHQPRPWALPAGVGLQVWDDFKKNRSRKRLPNTDTAWKSFLDDLARVSLQTGIPPPELIQRCTAKGWGAIYDPREKDDDRGKSYRGLGSGAGRTTQAAAAAFGDPSGWSADRNF